MENYLLEAFQKLSLLEDDFNFSADKDVVDELQSFVADDIEEIPEEPVIDVTAEDEQDLADNYVGKVILECECCHTRIYKEESEVIVDPEQGLANVEEVCPVCGNTMGYSVIGKIEKFEDTPIDDSEEETELELDAVEEEEPKESLFDRVRRKRVTENREDVCPECGKNPCVCEKCEKESLDEELGYIELDKETELPPASELQSDDAAKLEAPGENPVLEEGLNEAPEDLDYGKLLGARDVSVYDEIAKFAKKPMNKLNATLEHIRNTFGEDIYEKAWMAATDQVWGDFSAVSNEGVTLGPKLIGNKVPLIGFVDLDDDEDFRAKYPEGLEVLLYPSTKTFVFDRDSYESFDFSKPLTSKDAYEYALESLSYRKKDYFREIERIISYGFEEIDEILEEEGLELTDDADFIKYDESLKEAAGLDIGKRNATAFYNYLSNNEGLTIGYWGEGEAEIEENGDHYDIRLYSQIAEFEVRFYKDGRVYVSAEDEEEDDDISEEFDSYNEFVDWYKSMMFSWTSDFGDNLEHLQDDASVIDYDESLKEAGPGKPGRVSKKELQDWLDKEYPAIRKRNDEVDAELQKDRDAWWDKYAKENPEKYAKMVKKYESYVSDKQKARVKDESLKEGIENLSMDTDDTHVEMTSTPDGGATVSVEPKNGDSELLPDDGEEEIVPLSDEEEEEILANEPEGEEDVDDFDFEEEPIEDEEEEEEIPEESLKGSKKSSINEEVEEDDMDIDEFDESKFNDICESYLRRVYENVNTFNTVAVKDSGDKIVVEGIIKFKNGKQMKSNFVFTEANETKSGKLVLEGYNETFSKQPKSFRLSGSLNKNKFVAESMRYNYVAKNLNEGKVENTRVSGRVRAKK